MRNTARLLAALLSLTAPALAQNVPANTVQGRLGIPAGGGPVVSIGFAALRNALSIASPAADVTSTAYGGICNDTTASTTNISALTLAAAASPAVFIPKSCIFYLDTATLPAGLKLLYGAGGASSSRIVQPTGHGIGDAYFLRHTGSLVLRDLAITSDIINGAGKASLLTEGATDVTLLDVELAGDRAWYIATSSNVTGINVHISNWVATGLYCNTSSYVHFYGPKVDATNDVASQGHGIGFDDCSYSGVHGGYVKQWGQFGVYTASGSPSTLLGHDNVIEGVTITGGSAAREAIVVSQGYNIVVANNIVNGLTGHADRGIGIYSDNSVSDAGVLHDVVVSGNIVSNAGGDAIASLNAANVSIIGNVIKNPAQAEAGDACIYVGGLLAAYNQVTGNVCRDDSIQVSTTSRLIGTGSKTFTTSCLVPWTAGKLLRIASKAAPSTNYMDGTVTSCVAGTLTMNITSVGGAGTFADWGIGRMAWAFAETSVNGSIATGPNTFDANIGNSGYADVTRIQAATSRAITGGLVNQSAGDLAGSGYRIQANNDSTNYWDLYSVVSSHALRLSKNGVFGLSIDPSGNLFPDGYVQFSGSTSGTTQVKAPAIAGTGVYTLPGTGTSTLAALGIVQQWTAVQSYTNGNFALMGSVSGTTTVAANSTGTQTVTLPGATDTLVGKATTDTLTNKTFSTTGTGNAFTVGAVSLDTAWTAYTPTITSGSGTFTTTSATGAYKQIGKIVHVRITITITTNGTAAGRVEASLPVTANIATGSQALSGYNDSTAVVLSAAIAAGISASKVLLFSATGTYPGASSTVLIAQGTYEAS